MVLLHESTFDDDRDMRPNEPVEEVVEPEEIIVDDGFDHFYSFAVQTSQPISNSKRLIKDLEDIPAMIKSVARVVQVSYPILLVWYVTDIKLTQSQFGAFMAQIHIDFEKRGITVARIGLERYEVIPRQPVSVEGVADGNVVGDINSQEA